LKAQNDKMSANIEAIAPSCDALDHAARAGFALPPAGVRLLDGYHLLEVQLRRHARELSALGKDDVARAGRLVQETVERADGRIDPDELARFLGASQQDDPLRIAELDAIPALLRRALLGRLGALAARAARTCAGREQAAAWAARLLDTAETRPGDLVLLVADMARGEDVTNAGFLAELALRLQGRGAALAQVLDWVDARLADADTSIAQETQRERSEQDTDAVSAGNALASLRRLGGVDWRAFAEALGAVDAVLREDPDGSYARMDHGTRDRYRHAVARLARSTGASEVAVATAAIELAGVNRAPGEGGLDLRKRHVGHYLVGPDLPALVSRLRGGGQPERRPQAQAGVGVGIAATAVLTVLLMAAIVVHARQGDAGTLLLVLIALFALPGAHQLARSLVRMAGRWLASPAATPRMDVDAGLPEDAHTVVAVCAQAEHALHITTLCADLEVRYLGNRDARLRFCLLLDLPDAKHETVPGDEPMLAQAQSAIEALNRQHGERFLLLVRPRSWSVDQQAWIGRERQRGQLVDLNAWLCGARERFVLAAGATGAGAEVRYVIALDASTALARDAARSLVAAMSHPLHLPIQDDRGQVLEGHGMLRPEIGVALPDGGAMRYQRLWPELAELDGRHGWAAIYDVDAWRRAVGDTLEDEGRAAPGLVEEDRLRAGRVRDLRLDAGHPGSYGEHVLRRHRALRAAWQEARRLGHGAGRLHAARLRWRLFDTLSSSLVAPASMALLVLCWCLLAAPAFWTAAVLAVLVLPPVLELLVALADRPSDAPWRQHLDGWVRHARTALVRAAMSVAFLPHTAWVEGDAIVRGLWRRDVAHRQLLELRPPALARSSRRMEHNWRAMWFAPTLAVGVAMLLTFANPYAMFTTAPLLLAWFLSPVLAWWVSQPSRRIVRLGAAPTAFLRALARRSWGFFEQHDGGVHGLAPEAVFEHPEPACDTRVSPAGMGLNLLATLSARDFGFLPLGGLLERSERALSAMALLESWRGHLLEWYDGTTLGPIEPARVDTAASGSLVLALRTFAAGLDELPGRRVVDGSALDGIRATLLVVGDYAKAATPPLRQALDAASTALAPERCRAVDTLPGLADCLRTAAQEAVRLAIALPMDADPALRAWVARLERQCDTQLQDLYAMAPWVRVAQEYVLDASLTRIPTLGELACLDAPGASGGLARLVEEGRACARTRLETLAALAAQGRQLARADFAALADSASGQLAAGYQVRDKSLDSDSCDLLASEARMASFAAVAQDQLPQQHWWSLGRPLRMAGVHTLLLSRHGTIADLLAPQVLLPSWRGTLFDRAGRALVRAQAAHARARGQLWGYTASACNAVDGAARYRFGRFGLAAASLRRQRDDGLVAAPHGAALALIAAPALAAANLQRMAGQGLLGEYGFYEALDYAPGRLPQGTSQAVVRAYAARHQATTLLALARHLQGEPMQRRFCRDPELRAALGLLQEPLPVSGAEPALRFDSGVAADGIAAQQPYARVIGQDGLALPEIQLLSNGRYHLALGSDGLGASRWEEAELARSAMTCHVRDTESYEAWSNLATPAERFEAVFTEGRASIMRLDQGIEMVTDVVVAPLHDAELHRIRIVNRGSAARTLALSSSIALVGPPLEEGGRSGIKLEYDRANASLLCVTTPDAPVVVHRMALRGSAAQPNVKDLDTEPDEPRLALHCTVTLAPQQEVTLDLVLGAASSRAIARELAAQYGAGHAVDRAIEAAWTQAQAFLRSSEIGEADAQLYNRLAGCLLQPVPALRADPAVIARNALGRASLLPYGVSGALPLLLLQLGEGPDTGLARQLLQAHGYWRSRGLAVDFLVLCDSRAAREQLMHQAMELLDPDSFDRPGGLHLYIKPDVPQEDRILLRSAARVLLISERGDLADQLRRAARPGPALPAPFQRAENAPAWTAETPPLTPPATLFDNGVGGFTEDGREYVVHTTTESAATWINLPANPEFGSRVSANGRAFSWSGQRDTRVTQDGEAFYLRDEDSGACWSPTPWPAPSAAPYIVRHGFGYSVFEHRAHGIHSELRTFVAQDAPLKYSVLRLRNDSDAPRRLSATGYVAWLLDDPNAPPGLQVVTGIDLASGALLARNVFGEGLRDKVAFFHVEAEQVAATGDRREFIGHRDDPARPAAMERAGLSGIAGAGLDPCAALQVQVALEPGAQCELVFVLGVAGPGSLDASRMAQAHGGPRAAQQAWARLGEWWDTTLAALQVRTPDASFDLRVNGWLPYQAIAATMGERDPAVRLQSALASVHARPELLRDQLLRGARDFAAEPAAAVEDFLWLPYALARYLEVTGEQAVLAALPFEGGGGDNELAARDDLYQHCVHGLRGSLRFGPRGLPPAAGRLHDEGIPGRVESVRLGFFMATVLQRFADVADRRGDFGFATTCRGAALALRAQCEEHGWDGDWYRWTWLDSSTALGSIANAACRAELSTQCWAVQAEAGQGAAALRAAARRLVDDAHGVALLCDPPVDGHWSERVAASPGQDHRATAWAAACFARLGDPGRAWQLAQMLDPLARGSSASGAPPYLLSGGLRTIAPHAGRAIGGSCSAAPAWTWLALVEALLGLERKGNELSLRPRLAPGWDGFSLEYRYHSARYAITVRAGGGAEGILLDGRPCPGWTVALQDDRRDHTIDVRIAGTPAIGPPDKKD